MQPTSLIASLALLAPAVLGSFTYHPPSGSGKIPVTLMGNLSPTGCLDVDGFWTVAGDCATFGGDGVGDMGTTAGHCDLTSTANILCTETVENTEWLGLYIDGNSSAIFLAANPGSGPPSGGWTWYAPSVPSGSGTVSINGLAASDSVHVTLSWIAS